MSDDIRQKAEALLENGQQSEETQDADNLNQLIHELRVHQVELELQNEELRRTQTELEQAQSKYFNLYHFAPVGYMTLDQEGRILETNLTGARLLNRERQYLLQKPLLLYLAPDSHYTFYSHREKVFARPEISHTCELTLRSGNTRPVHIRLESSAAVDESGQPSHWRAIMVDITARKEAEFVLSEREKLTNLSLELIAALTQSQTLHDTLDHCANALIEQLNLALVRIWLLDETQERLLLQASAGLTNSLKGACHNIPVGQGQIGLVARKRQLHLVEDIKAHPDLCQSLWRHHQNVTAFVGYPLIADKGLLGVIGLFGRRMLSQTVLTGLSSLADAIALGIVHKITEIELQQAREIAETANRAKTDFLARMSHELRTPLNAILGYAQILQNDHDLTAPGQEALTIIHRSGQHLLTLIDDILDLSKIEIEKMELYLTEFDLPEFLKHLVDIFRIRATEKGIAFEYEQLTELPTSVQADEKRLRQILTNLLSNAIKFTGQGAVKLRVELNDTWTTKNKSIASIRFEVEDTGSGISIAQMPNIFEPFRQANDSNEFIEGTGLGLSISQHLVQMMNSELQVESKAGQGSRFWFDLALPIIDSRTVSAPRQKVVGFRGEARQILIVDDLQENRSFLKDILEPLGFEIHQAIDGLNGLKQLQQLRPAVILVDLRMPNMDGFEFVRQVRRLPELPQPVIIAISASAFEEQRRQSLAAGCDDFLAKPVKVSHLLTRLEKHLDIEWIYQERSSSPPEAGHKPLLPPPAAEIEALQELTKYGDIRGILELAQKIEQLDDKYRPFTEKIQQMARGYQINKIKLFITDYTKGSDQ